MNTASRRKIAIPACAVVIAIFGCAILGLSADSGQTRPAGRTAEKRPPKPDTEKPAVIWFHSTPSYPAESLEIALSSGIPTHVLLLCMHRADMDWKKNPQVCRAIQAVKKSPAKLIWSRNLWPYYAKKQVTLAQFLDPDYYVGEIKILSAEAREIGADLVALDSEPYGSSSMKRYIKGKYQFDTGQLNRLSAAINRAVQTVGKVDFILPAGSLRKTHPYNILARLAEMRISENTYYSNERLIRRIAYPYEIFGAFVRLSRERPGRPEAPFFLVSDIFERTDLWVDKKGLFLFTAKQESVAVARALVKYAAAKPEETRRP